MTFEAVAKEVIKESIRSAICIDDQYPSAYSSSEDLSIDEPSKLYNSFREVGQCDLDIYQFRSLEDSWKKEFMIPNKDLMILDWELDQVAKPKYKDTLDILKDVILSDQIPFVVIYTNATDLHEVSRILLSEFNYVTANFDFDSVFDSLNERFGRIPHGEFEIDFETLIDDPDIKKLFFDYLFFHNKKEVTKSSILKAIIESIELKVGEGGTCAAIARCLKGKVQEDKDYLKALALIALSMEINNETPYSIQRVEAEQPIFKINGTTVLIYHKSDNGDGVKPEDLFDVFSKAIIANPHNYLSLLSLELKDQLRKEFSKIGTRFLKIDERAFFYHMQNFRDGEGKEFNHHRIYDFVINSWLQDLNSQKFEGESKVITCIGERFQIVEGQIPKEIDRTIEDPLVKYSALLSTSRLQRPDKNLRFGDIFKIKDSTEFVICITPHCDCLNSVEKIKNNFYFIKGDIGNKQLAIRKAEQKFYSFLDVENEALCINWACKPFTAYVAKNNIDELSFSYTDKVLNLEYVTTLKENFTQRISNESFGYGFRVGIDLPHEVDK